MKLKNIFLYSISGTLTTAATVTPIVLDQSKNINLLDKQNIDNQIYVSSDYRYNHKLFIKQNNLNSFKEVLSNINASTTIIENIKKDLNIKNIDIKIDLNQLEQINKNTYSCIFLATPKKNHIWKDKTNSQKQVKIIFNNVVENKNIIKQINSFNYDKQNLINKNSVEDFNAFLEDKNNLANIFEFIKKQLNNNELSIQLNSQVYYQENNFKVNLLITSSKHYFENQKNSYISTLIFSNSISDANVLTRKIKDEYIIQVWWAKEIYESSDLYKEIFTKEMFYLLKSAFENENPELKITKFDIKSCFAGRYANYFDSSYKAYVYAKVAYKYNVDYQKKVKLFIEGWDVINDYETI